MDVPCALRDFEASKLRGPCGKTFCEQHLNAIAVVINKKRPPPKLEVDVYCIKSIRLF